MHRVDDESQADAPAPVRRRGIDCLKATASARDRDAARVERDIPVAASSSNQEPADRPDADDEPPWPRLLLPSTRRVSRPEGRTSSDERVPLGKLPVERSLARLSAVLAIAGDLFGR
jgi:hypothetical protein